MKTLFRTVLPPLAAVSLLWSPGCGTIVPKTVEAKTQGFAALPVKTAAGYLVNQAFADRFNALISVYGNSKLPNGAPIWVPALKKGFGLTAIGQGQWLMTDEAMADMIVLDGLQKEGLKP